jgi:hypothetical protein
MPKTVEIILKEKALVSATGIDGSNLIVFAGAEYAEMVGAKALEMADGGYFALAEEYVKAMGSISITMDNCTAAFDNSGKK